LEIRKGSGVNYPIRIEEKRQLRRVGREGQHEPQQTAQVVLESGGAHAADFVVRRINSSTNIIGRRPTEIKMNLAIRVFIIRAIGAAGRVSTF
jgi:hypothetical protein